MQSYPSIPVVGDPEADEVIQEGHLWIQEKVDGANFRFQLQESGLLVFGSRNRVFRSDDVPLPYRHAVDFVRRRLERDRLRDAVDDVADVVFFGEAMHKHTIEYDWDRTPSVLGFDIWSAQHGFLPPDVVEQIYERLGLCPINTIRKELPARDFQPHSYEIPRSNWYDGPAEGVIIRNKAGGRAKLLHPAFDDVDDTVALTGDADTLARRYATPRRLEQLTDALTDEGQPVTVDTLSERALTEIVREHHKALYHSDTDLDQQAFRSAIARATQQFLSR